jgi:cytochrome c
MKKTLAISAALAALGMATGAHAQDPAKLAQEKACLSCHQLDRKLIGPSYKEVATKYRNDKGALARLAKKVREGGQGAWGAIPMPPNPSVTDKEAEILVKWVLSQK